MRAQRPAPATQAGAATRPVQETSRVPRLRRRYEVVRSARTQRAVWLRGRARALRELCRAAGGRRRSRSLPFSATMLLGLACVIGRGSIHPARFVIVAGLPDWLCFWLCWGLRPQTPRRDRPARPRHPSRWDFRPRPQILRVPMLNCCLTCLVAWKPGTPSRAATRAAPTIRAQWAATRAAPTIRAQRDHISRCAHGHDSTTRFVGNAYFAEGVLGGTGTVPTNRGPGRSARRERVRGEAPR